MSRSLNKVLLIGNLGADPETRDVNDRAVSNFSLATTAQWKGQDGRKMEKTEWHRCTVWGPLADVVDKYVRKGDKLYIEGRVEYRKWQDKDGQDRYSTDIIVSELVMLGSPRGNDNARSAARPRSDQGGGGRDDYRDGDGGDGGADDADQGDFSDFEPPEDAAPRRETRPAARPARSGKSSRGARPRQRGRGR